MYVFLQVDYIYIFSYDKSVNISEFNDNMVDIFLLKKNLVKYASHDMSVLLWW